jgi:hypothetical protein
MNTMLRHAKRNFGLLAAALLSSTILAPAVQAELESDERPRRLWVSVGTGLEFVRGDYGDVDADGDKVYTNSGSIPVFARIEWEPITFRIRVPFLIVDGSDQVLGGNDGTEPNGDGSAGRRTDYGLGDVTTSLTYTYYPPRSLPAVPVVDVTLRAKIPTAMNGLGTGNTDLTPQLELSKTLAGFTLYAGSGYRFRTGTGFDDNWLAYVGASYRIIPTLSLGVGYDYREASTSFSEDGHEVSTFLTIRSGEHLRITPEALFGLSDGSPDYGGAITFSYQF